MADSGGVGLAVGVLAVLALSPAAAASADIIEPAAHVTIETAEATAISIDGMRVLGSVELLADGTVINEVPIESYVAGVAEMPSRWPIEALKAQAVAARTYAWWSILHAEHGEADICDSSACQVYRGADVVDDGGDRWARAVEETRSEVLVDDAGSPILARYFSTSGGRTYANEDVFPSTGTHPALRAIDDPYDAASPYHRWEVRFSRAEFDDILSRGERLSNVVPIADVSRVGGVDEHGAVIAVTGENGGEVELSALELRDFISRVAPERFPGRFPSARSDGLVELPSTLPSSRFAVDVSPQEVVFHGRGWGHGVGLGQYGARGRARQGASYTEILAAYYGGVAPSVSDELPEDVRVALGTSGEVVVRPESAFTIEADGVVVVDHALGGWRFDHDGTRWRISAPAEHGKTLKVDATRIVSSGVHRRVPFVVEAGVNKPAQLRLEVVDDAGQTVFVRDLGVVDPGRHAAAWGYVDLSGEPVRAGEYRLAMTASDADTTRSAAPVTVTVDPTDGPRRGPLRSNARSILTALAASVAAVSCLVVVRKVRA